MITTTIPASAAVKTAIGIHKLVVSPVFGASGVFSGVSTGFSGSVGTSVSFTV